MLLSLIGYRGTGKTTVARLLASGLGWESVDADTEIQSRAGQSIAAIFAQHGEPHFRALESQMVTQLCARDRLVVAWGGGVILRPENRAALQQAGKTVWLTADPATLAHRIGSDPTTPTHRPSLTSLGGMDEIIATLEKRSPLYRECADFVVDTEGKTPETVASEIVAWFRKT